jgi:hypothetical protein
MDWAVDEVGDSCMALEYTSVVCVGTCMDCRWFCDCTFSIRESRADRRTRMWLHVLLGAGVTPAHPM